MIRPFRALPQAPKGKDAEPQVVMPVWVPPRRGLLSILGALAIPVATSAATLTAADPDAELIRICEAHPEKIRAAEEDSTYEEDCPLWLAYERSRDAIHAAVPMTLAGIIAKARAAKVEAANPEGGTESPSGTPGETWAWDLVNDLLRLEGCA